MTSSGVGGFQFDSCSQIVTFTAPMVGNYGVAPMPSDPTAPGPVYKTGNSNASSSSNLADFRNTGVNMSSESLYPGDASFRNPVFGKSLANGGTNPAGNVLATVDGDLVGHASVVVRRLVVANPLPAIVRLFELTAIDQSLDVVRGPFVPVG